MCARTPPSTNTQPQQQPHHHTTNKQAVEIDPCLGYNLEATDWSRASLSVIVLGASGDLAKKKIFPALFALYYEGLLPEVRVVGWGGWGGDGRRKRRAVDGGQAVGRVCQCGGLGTDRDDVGMCGACGPAVAGSCVRHTRLATCQLCGLPALLISLWLTTRYYGLLSPLFPRHFTRFPSPCSHSPSTTQDFQVFGYARSKMSDGEFRELIESTLTCRINARWVCGFVCVEGQGWLGGPGGGVANGKQGVA